MKYAKNVGSWLNYEISNRSLGIQQSERVVTKEG